MVGKGLKENGQQTQKMADKVNESMTQLHARAVSKELQLRPSPSAVAASAVYGTPNLKQPVSRAEDRAHSLLSRKM